MKKSETETCLLNYSVKMKKKTTSVPREPRDLCFFFYFLSDYILKFSPNNEIFQPFYLDNV